MEKLASVKRVEVFTDKNEAVIELENAAVNFVFMSWRICLTISQEAGKLLLQTEPIVFNGATLQLLEESQVKASANSPDTSGLFVPRTAASRPKAGIGHKRKVVQPIHSAPSESKSNADASSSSAPPASKKGQDDFRKMLGGK